MARRADERDNGADADGEVGYLAARFGVSIDRVRQAMQQVGPLRPAVEEELRRQPLIEQ